MKFNLSEGMLEATRLTKAGLLTEATAAIQRALGGPRGMKQNETVTTSPTIDGEWSTAELLPPPKRTEPVGESGGQRGLLDQLLPKDLQNPASTSSNGGQFISAHFSSQAGSRPYKLFIPTGYREGQPIPLIVMLHGCTQSPDDFAAGTRMNDIAEQHTCIVVWPGQTSSANMQKCWNWFNESDQHRDRGEPSLISGITREVMNEYSVDSRRVYIAGLSAGGAAAAIMGETYPDLYAAIGVHSGLACGAARDMPSAFAAMKGGGASPRRAGRPVPTIVFHGDKDTTVNPRNGDAVVEQSSRTAKLTAHEESGQVPGWRAYRRTFYTDAKGQTIIEKWTITGAGHAWSGGSPSGSYTDPRGPDATKEIVRFFLEHPRI
jgi:poly(hydroxyalkanoate) depolymerase family esterase